MIEVFQFIIETSLSQKYNNWKHHWKVEAAKRKRWKWMKIKWKIRRTFDAKKPQQSCTKKLTLSGRSIGIYKTRILSFLFCYQERAIGSSQEVLKNSYLPTEENLWNLSKRYMWFWTKDTVFSGGTCITSQKVKKMCFSHLNA